KYCKNTKGGFTAAVGEAGSSIKKVQGVYVQA
ncbi:MAG: hypothetical protein UX87_C0017G0001, partial [Candidatus Amesbacteria bacterium GW2011_GWA1_47_16]